MAILNVLNVLSSAFALYLFVVVRRMKIRAREHRLLSWAALALFAWNTLAYAVYNTQQLELVRILLPLSCVPMYLFFPLVFHFAYALYRKRSLTVPATVALYGPGVVLGVISFFIPVSLNPVMAPTGGIELQVPVGSIPTTVWSLYSVGCWVAALVIAVRHYRATTLNREKRQGALLVQWLIINIVLVLGEFYATAMIPWWTIPPQSPMLMSIWVGAMVYAIWKYGFLRISPGLLAEQILDSIEDLVLLYDLEGNRVYENHKASTILGRGKALALFSADPLQQPVGRLLNEARRWRKNEAERRMRLRVPNTPVSPSHWFTIDSRVKPVFDTFDDPLGVVVSGTIVPQEHELQEQFQLTDREAEILELLAAGWTIKRTADALCITERTVKAHITSIYEKTGAGNRVELMNVLNVGPKPIGEPFDSD